MDTLQKKKNKGRTSASSYQFMTF